jgi:hypothetical protein
MELLAIGPDGRPRNIDEQEKAQELRLIAEAYSGFCKTPAQMKVEARLNPKK